VVSKKNKKEKKTEIKRYYNPTGNYIPTGRIAFLFLSSSYPYVKKERLVTA
jgi:hypothetical protein